VSYHELVKRYTREISTAIEAIEAVADLLCFTKEKTANEIINEYVMLRGN
jgi:hypothetical protein